MSNFPSNIRNILSNIPFFMLTICNIWTILFSLFHQMQNTKVSCI